MPRRNLIQYFQRIRELKSEIDSNVPLSRPGLALFRADLSGLFVVYIAANYENCVKDSINSYAGRYHVRFGEYTFRNYGKLNSRIAVNDLTKYASNFGPDVERRFKDSLRVANDKELAKSGFSLKKRYEQLLAWRHDYAHAGIKNTTVEEAFEFHSLAKDVLYCFEVALNGE